MITVEGKNGIKATILADSISPQGVRLITWEAEYPRLVLAELNTHRMLSRNSFSSRAVPFEKMLQQLNGQPVRFGANQPGMQDRGEDFDAKVKAYYASVGTTLTPEEAWEEAKTSAIWHAKEFYDAGYHKQVYNRLLEPFQMMKTVITATEDANFFWLRDDDAADPTLRELARVMREAKEGSVPDLLKPGQWHLPYLNWTRDTETGEQMFYICDETNGVTMITLDEAIKVSCARCAAVSYRNEGYGLEKSLEVYDRLVGSERKHASAFEHQATPVREWGFYESVYGGTYQQNHAYVPFTWEEGITHVDRKGNLWSGNLKGWIQYRKLIKGENYEGEEVT